MRQDRKKLKPAFSDELSGNCMKHSSFPDLMWPTDLECFSESEISDYD